MIVHVDCHTYQITVTQFIFAAIKFGNFDFKPILGAFIFTDCGTSLYRKTAKPL